jgi:hypothetical protein
MRVPQVPGRAPHSVSWHAHGTTQTWRASGTAHREGGHE